MSIRICGDNTVASPAITSASDTDTGLQFGTNEVKVVNGDLDITDGNLIVAAGHGIDFSATADGSGTMTSELLDDYEEGTWTPEFRMNDSYSGQSYTDQIGRYVKIGEQVTVWYKCTLSSVGSFSGSFPKIGGFPYPVSSQINTVNSGQAYFVSLGIGVISVNHQLHEGTDSSFYWTKTGTGVSREYTNQLFGNTTQITGTIVYRTT